MELFTPVLDILEKFSTILVPSFWICFAVCGLWFLASAKRCAPLTSEEARILWKIHKRNAECVARRWCIIRRGNRIVGFECGCGYKYMHKRPMI